MLKFRLVYSCFIAIFALFIATSEIKADGPVWMDYYHEDFNGANNQWDRYPRDGQISYSGGAIHLSASNATLYPVTFNSECTPANPNCNTSSPDPQPMPARNYDGRHPDLSDTWQSQVDYRVQFRYQGVCSGCAGLGVNAMYSQNAANQTSFAVVYHKNAGHQLTLDGNTFSIRSADQNWHTVEVQRIWNQWQVYFDGALAMSRAASQPNPNSRINTNLNIGNPNSSPNGNVKWPGMNVDWVDVDYAVPDAWFSSTGNPPSPQPMNTNTTFSVAAGDIRGVGRVDFYINSANDGSSSGSWLLFGQANGGGQQNAALSAAINCVSLQAANGGNPVCARRHLVVANVYDQYGNLRQQWNRETRLQTVYEWTIPNLTYIISRSLRCPLDNSTPTQPGAVQWQYYVRITPQPGVNQVVGQNTANFSYNLSVPLDYDAYFGVLRNGVLYGTETLIDPTTTPSGTTFSQVLYDLPNSPDCPQPTPTPPPQPVTVRYNITCPAGQTLSAAASYSLIYRVGGNPTLITLLNGSSGQYTFNGTGWTGSTIYMYGRDPARSQNLSLTTTAPPAPQAGFAVIAGVVQIIFNQIAAGVYQLNFAANPADCAAPPTNTPTATATPTNTSTPTRTPTNTPTATPTNTPPSIVSTPVVETPVITPVAFIDTRGTVLDPTRQPTPGPGTPTPSPSGLTVAGFYYPLQVWLNMVPSVIVATPARYCVNSICYDAVTKPIDYTYLGMEREDGQLVAATPYSRTFKTAPYDFDPSQYLRLFWEFPHIDDGLGLHPPQYYYLNQKPGQVKFHYRVTLESRWSITQTTSWPASPAPPGSWPWGGPGTAYLRRDEVTLNPAAGRYLWLYLTRPVIERQQ